jgi:uncharacterized membrane protein
MITGACTGRSIDYKGTMTLYEFLLFVHIMATVVWVGAGVMGLVLAAGYIRDTDAAAIQRFLKDQEPLAQRLFIPSALVVVVFGIALVIESDAWTFGYLWIVLGLIGFATTFVTGAFLLKPVSDRIHAQMELDSGLTPHTFVELQKLLVKARSDYVVLFLVIADMVIKPTGDDVAVLVVMALIALAGVAYIFARVRAIDAQRQPAPATG